MELITAVLFFAVFGALSVMFGCDSRPSEHDQQHNW
jgi:hypothetical protein